VVARIVAQVLGADAIELADLTPLRDFCFVDDVVDAMVLAAKRRADDDAPTFNVASGVGVTIGELARAAAAAACRDLPVRARRTEDPTRRADIHELIADTSRIRGRAWLEPAHGARRWAASHDRMVGNSEDA